MKLKNHTAFIALLWYNEPHFMPKKRVRQVGGTKEAPLAIVEGSVVAEQPAPVQGNAGQEQQDTFRYSELLLTFDATMKRWQSTICTPQYLTRHNAQEGTENDAWLWTYSIVYPSTNPRIEPRDEYPSQDERLAVLTTSSKHDDFLSLFSLEVMGAWNKAFVDPYNNEHLTRLNILVHQHNPAYFEGFKVKDPFYYTLAIGGSYGHEAPDGFGTIDRKDRALEFSGSNLSGELRLKVGKVGYGGTYISKDAEVLPLDHAIALFNLVDTLIPPVSRRFTQQTGRRTTPETPTPKTLPAPRRGRPAGR